MPSDPAFWFSRRYELLEELGRGGMGAVYRAQDRLTGRVIALKKVMSPSAGRELDDQSETMHLDPGSTPSIKFSSSTAVDSAYTMARVALAHEFRILASLRHPNIVNVFDYGFYPAEQPYFTMELLNSPTTLPVAGSSLSLDGKIDLLAQLLRALAYLHRRGILHRDIKPSNVLCLGTQVKVLDFGIASSIAHEGELAGTVEYMAPELFLGGQPSVASDLYAVGIVAFELLAGYFPNKRASLTSLLEGDHGAPTTDLHLSKLSSALPPDAKGTFNFPKEQMALELDPMSLLSPVIGEPLAAILSKLLSRAPEKRPESAIEVLKDLSRAGYPMAIETTATRESFLQASELVGREAELGRLESALAKMLNGVGSAWLLGGESGVGKSRLLEEIRSLAMVKGGLVLHGQAVSTGGVAYQVFADVLPMLCLAADLSDFDASVLKAVVPHLSTLLERDIEDAPELSPVATQARLLNVVSALFARLAFPTVLILEDLHWAEPESITLLDRLAKMAPQRNLMIIGSFRDDEVKGLSQQLSTMHLLKLQRLSTQSIFALSRSMLGDSGANAKVVDFLVRETEGNAFFIVEVIRALAEETGQLSEVGQRTLPAGIVAGGMKQVIARRLGRVPQRARKMLRLAAVLGRQLDVRVLRSLEPDIDELLGACADAAVLEVCDAEWRFSHDKLREGVLNEISSGEAVQLHQTLALAIEKEYRDEDVPVAVLAYHFQRAGEFDRSLHYSVLAGEQAIRVGAMGDAVAMLKQALNLTQQLTVSNDLRARIQQLLIRALYGQGRFSDCVPLHQSASALLGDPLPEGKKPLILGVVNQLKRQLYYRMRPDKIPPLPEQERKTKAARIELHQSMLEVYGWLGQLPQVLYCALDGLNTADQLADAGKQATWNSVFAYMLSLAPLRAPSRYYLAQSQRKAHAVAEPRHQADILRVSGFFRMYAGRWNAALSYFEEGAALCQRLGDEPLYLYFMLQIVSIYEYRGDLNEAWKQCERLIELCKRNHSHERYQLWFEATKASILLHRRQASEALTILLGISEKLAQIDDVLLFVCTSGQLAVCLLELDDHQQAKHWAGATIHRLSGRGMAGHGGLEGFPGPVEVFFSLWQQAKSASEKQSLHASLLLSLAVLKKYARVFPIGNSRYLLWLARYHLAQGNPLRAFLHLRDSVAAATQCGMPYDLALAELELGELLRAHPTLKLADEPQRHIALAAKLFSRLGNAPKAEQARSRFVAHAKETKA